MNFSGDWLFSLATRGTVSLLVLSWQALILIACVWAGLKIFRVKRPNLRHQIWLLTLAAIVVLPLADKHTSGFPLLRPPNPTLGILVEAPGAALAQAARSQTVTVIEPPGSARNSAWHVS